MIVCPDYKLCFLHVPRTGGTSIAKALEPHASRNEEMARFWKPRDQHWTPPHSSYAENERFFKANPGNTVAAFVRNPFSRIVSMYRVQPDGAKNFDDYLRRWPGPLTSADLKPWQSDFIGEADFVGRFESLQEDFDRLCDQVGMPKSKLEHLSNRRVGSAGWNQQAKEFAPIQELPWQAAYTTQARIDRVAALCAEDIERFGYEPPAIWQETAA